MKNNQKNMPLQTVKRRYQGQRRLRPWMVSHFGGMEAAKLHPLACCAFRPDEGGTVSTMLNVNLAPVSGYMRSNAYAHVQQVFVPYQAIEKLELAEQADAGVTEMTRRRLMAGEGIGLEAENVISKAAYVHPKAIGGSKKVSKTVRLAYIAAVNHLRRVAYFNAALLPKTETAIQPALLTANILERFEGVLEPEKLVDGAINLTGELPVRGIALAAERYHPDGAARDVYETGGNATTYHGWNQHTASTGVNAGSGIFTLGADPDNPGFPKVFADLSGAGEITLRDMMQSKKLDELVRSFAQMINDDPLHGEEKVARALYGLSVDYDDDCQVMYDHVYEIAPRHQRPTDGASINQISAHFELNDRFATVVPRSELGGQLITLVSVKPLETLDERPDPAQTEVWQVRNIIHEETELDEQLLPRRELESNIAAIDEDTPAFWVGYNSHLHHYSVQGPNVQQTSNIEMQSSMWTYPIPTSVTPENISYPGTINMYPFFNWNGSAAEYTIRQVAAISTSLARGPNPVERIQLFADDPSLITEDV